jgi:hypothetical protein
MNKALEFLETKNKEINFNNIENIKYTIETLNKDRLIIIN